MIDFGFELELDRRLPFEAVQRFAEGLHIAVPDHLAPRLDDLVKTGFPFLVWNRESLAEPVGDFSRPRSARATGPARSELGVAVRKGHWIFADRSIRKTD
jgi:hypothetical protein